MDDISVSVIVPVFNVETYLDKCICSVMKQSYTNWELILVDDGSTDMSPSICDKYASQKSNISVYHKVNEGAFASRRYGIHKAKGEYVIFLDSDDMLGSDALKTITSVIEKEKCDCVVYGLKRVNDSGEQLEIWSDNETTMLKTKRDIYKKILLDVKYNSLCRKAIKTELILSIISGTKPSIIHGEDLLETLGIIEKIDSVVFIPDILYLYRFNEKSVSNREDYRKLLTDTIDVDTRVFLLLQELNIFSDRDFAELSSYYLFVVLSIMCKLASSTSKHKYLQHFMILKDSIMYRDLITKYPHSFKDLGCYYLLYVFLKRGYYLPLVIAENIKILIKKIKKCL